MSTEEDALSRIFFYLKCIICILAFLGLIWILHKPVSKISGFLGLTLFWGFVGLVVSLANLLYYTLVLFFPKKKVDTFISNIGCWSLTSCVYFAIPLTLILASYTNFLQRDAGKYSIFIIGVSLAMGFFLACILFFKKEKEPKGKEAIPRLLELAEKEKCPNKKSQNKRQKKKSN